MFSVSEWFIKSSFHLAFTHNKQMVIVATGVCDSVPLHETEIFPGGQDKRMRRSARILHLYWGRGSNALNHTAWLPFSLSLSHSHTYSVSSLEDLAAVWRLLVIHTHQLQGIQTFTSTRQISYITAVYCSESHNSIHLLITDPLFPLSVSTVEQWWEKPFVLKR